MSRKQSPEEKYAEAVAKKIGTTQRRVLNLFRSALSEASLLAQQVDFNPDKPFTFDDYPLTKKRSDKLINDLQKQILSTVSASVAYAWDLAEKKNDELVKSVLGSQAVPHRRTEGVKAFTARREQGLSLSDRVWKYTDQFKEELEMSLDLGLRDGLDAPAMSRAVREYLAEPNKLFRRVRDEHGQLHLSSMAKAYHPGQGVYRSSYKNALRLTATETNMAYRTADYERIQELDFVRGIEVCLSNNHTLNGKPFHCICDEFAGKYPKDFKFIGWHPLCRCYVKTILSDDPFTPEDTPEVKDIPQGLKNWVANNGDRIDRAFDKGRPAYWLRDNASTLRLKHNVSKSYKPTLAERSKARHEARTSEQIEEIKRRWEVRGNIHQHAPELERIIKVYKSESPSLSTLSQKTLDGIRSGELRGDALKRRLSQITHKEEVKRQWDEYKPIHKLADLIHDPRMAVAHHGLEAVDTVHSSVSKKLASWEGLHIDELKKKLEFEINWVTKQKKYSTWEVARDAYTMKLREVDKAIKIEEAKAQAAYALAFAKTTKSKAVKELASELDLLLSKQWKSTSDIEQKAKELRAKVDKLIAKQTPKAKLGVSFKPEDYTQERKDRAVWDKDRGDKADKALIDTAGRQWSLASNDEKERVYEYTHHFCNVNEPLQGRSYIGYQTVEEFYHRVANIESYISKNKLPVDMWFTRGDDGLGAVASRIRFAGGVMPDKVEDLVGAVMQEGGFMSTASRKGEGFNYRSVIINIYAPKGTQAAYVEPISVFGNGSGMNWDGETRFKTFSSEQETLFQRGTKMRITKVYKEGGKTYIDCEVIGQELKPISYVNNEDIGF